MLALRPNCGGELVRRPVRPAAALLKFPEAAPASCARASEPSDYTSRWRFCC